MTISFTTTKTAKEKGTCKTRNKQEQGFFGFPRQPRLSVLSVSVADPDLQIREGSGHSDPEIRGGLEKGDDDCLKNFFRLSLV